MKWFTITIFYFLEFVNITNQSFPKNTVRVLLLIHFIHIKHVKALQLFCHLSPYAMLYAIVMAETDVQFDTKPLYINNTWIAIIYTCILYMYFRFFLWLLTGTSHFQVWLFTAVEMYWLLGLIRNQPTIYIALHCLAHLTKKGSVSHCIIEESPRTI